MSEYFTDGQIVPRRLRIFVATDRKAQHTVTFRGLVRVDGKVITLLTEDAGIFIKPTRRKMNNGTYKKSELVCCGFSIQRENPLKKKNEVANLTFITRDTKGGAA